MLLTVGIGTFFVFFTSYVRDGVRAGDLDQAQVHKKKSQGKNDPTNITTNTDKRNAINVHQKDQI